jgi:hypothetical protein
MHLDNTTFFEALHDGKGKTPSDEDGTHDVAGGRGGR